MTVTGSARLLRLLSVLQMRSSWTAAELAERLGITERTVRRDISRLRDLDYPIQAAPGVGGGYQLGNGAALPPLLLDDDEAVAVVLALRTATTSAVQGLEETALRALTTIERLLPSPLRRRVSALGSVSSLSMPSAEVDVQTLIAFGSAARDHRTVEMGYRDRDGAESRRLVEPLELVHLSRRWYLVAWDLGRDDWRTFRIDRVTGRVREDRRFVARSPPAENIAAWVAGRVSSTSYPREATVRLHAPIETMASRIGPSAGTLEAIDSKTCLLRAGAGTLDILALYLGLAGVDFDVIDPPDLRVHLLALAARFRRAAGETG